MLGLSADVVLIEPVEAERGRLSAMLSGAGLPGVRGYEDPVLALHEIFELNPALIIVNLDLDGMNGLDFLQELRPYAMSRLYLPIIAISGQESEDLRESAFELGARDFIALPVRRLDLIQRARNLLETKFLHESLHKSNLMLEERVRERTADLKRANLEIVNRLAAATNFRDDITGDHVLRVGSLSQQIALEMGMAEHDAEELGIAARLHDIGKIAIPDSILQKPGKLDEDEIMLMRSHTVLGAKMLSSSSSRIMQLAEEIAVSHHERWDGTGYPKGLAGEDIAFSGRICAVADVFDSLTSERQYKRAWPVETALLELEKNAGSQFDPEVVKAFCRIFHRSDDPQQLAA